ncbi:hypothetical protein SORDD16_00268 [Streptococcus oralis]|uniref:Uncharacterized protein n=1 Tax=Streptococcus oralis TaxID=1303 RepID=A0A139PG57_STROR|nr:hypothetical protein SORDD16_00268 [Streptococcus oralis]
MDFYGSQSRKMNQTPGEDLLVLSFLKGEMITLTSVIG